MVTIPDHAQQQQQPTQAAAPPSWLNISLDAALGFRANVFQISRAPPGKKSSSAGTSSTPTENSIAIHNGASGVVSRHTLEVLISLAKSFSTHFLPAQNQQPGAKPSGSTRYGHYQVVK